MKKKCCLIALALVFAVSLCAFQSEPADPPVTGEDGSPAVRYPQLNDLKSKEVYASNYYYTDANFAFSPKGDLISCTVFSPVEVVDMQNGVQTLALDELLEMAETQLAQKQTENGKGDTGPVTGAEFGLTRVKVPGTDEHYDYVPALTLYGGVRQMGRGPLGKISRSCWC